MVTLHEVITFLVSMQISISSLQTHNVNRCGRSRHLARKLSLRRKRSSPNVFEMAATETITSIILIKLIMVSLGTVRHPRRFFFSSRRRHTRFDCDWIRRVLFRSLKPIPWSEHLTAMAYGLDYALVCFLLAVWSFSHRSLTPRD